MIDEQEKQDILKLQEEIKFLNKKMDQLLEEIRQRDIANPFQMM